MDVVYCTEFNIDDVNEMVEIYHSVGWMGHNVANVVKIFNASTNYVFAYYNNQLVGFARAISDGVFNAAIYDVVVHKDYQKQGIAKTLVEHLLSEFNHLSCIHLISTIGNERFYQKLGFKKLKTGMAIYHKQHLAESYLIDERSTYGGDSIMFTK